MFSQNERQFNRWMLAGLFTGFALLIVAFVLIVTGLRNTARSSQLVQHTYEVKDAIANLTVALERSETARRGYLIRPSPHREQTYRTWSPRILPALHGLEKLVSDNPAQLRRVRVLRPIVVQELAEMDRTMDLALDGQVEQARANFGDVGGLASLQQLRDRTGQIGAVEERILADRLEVSNDQLTFVQWLLSITGLMLAAVATLTFWLVRRFTHDLLASRTRLNELNTNLEGAVRVRTADLQRANEEIQRFAYIVSHDLRSPLVNVMGFTAELDAANWQIANLVEKVEKENPELVTEQLKMAALEDLPEAIGFIRSSTQKMDRLINAILDLSRQGRRVLSPEHLPMDQLVSDIAATLEILAAERNARFLIEKPLPPIVSDRLAVEQMMGNLMENAVKYLHPGRPGVILVRGRTEGSRVKFEVEDNGRGIAPEDFDRVFDLFRRSGVQDQQGEGIGLANVRALAYRLGGTVTLRSKLSEGSTFVVDLPAEFSGGGLE